MVLYPEVQQKAQRELDTAMYLTGGNLKPGENHGDHSLPTFEDAENFPYVTALVQEVLRWNVTIPLGELRYSESPVCRCLLTSVYCHCVAS
jgi:cytochrome P450